MDVLVTLIEAYEERHFPIPIHALRHPRQGWEERFAIMAEQHDDQLLDEPLTTEWDKQEWTW